MEGSCDPYHMNVLKRGSGTKEKPTLVPSAFSGRIVGCICIQVKGILSSLMLKNFFYVAGKDNRFVNYMWLEKDCPKRCECGHWYKLKEVERFS